MTDPWRSVALSEVLEELHERCGARDLPVLSVTKDRGIMLASERFDRALHGRNLPQYRLAPRGSITLDPMLLWSGTIGRQKVVDAGIVSPDYRVYAARAGALPEFLEYAFKGKRLTAQFKASARGTNIRRNRISRADFVALKLELPPIPEQRKIAAILSSVDEAIEKTQAVIDQVQVVKQSLMQELLAKGLPGHHGTYKETEIGKIPETWEIRRLDSFSFVQTGLAKNKSNEGTHPIPYLRVANVQDGHLDLGEVKEIIVNEHAIERYRLHPGDVLFTEGGDADKLGRGTVWRGEIPLCLHQNHVFAVRVDPTVMTPDFLSLFGGSDRGKAYFLNAAKQTTNLASINSSQLRALPVPVPPLDEQRNIMAIIGTVDRRAVVERSMLGSLVTLKSALSTLLLTGELRVRASSEPTP